MEKAAEVQVYSRKYEEEGYRYAQVGRYKWVWKAGSIKKVVVVVQQHRKMQAKMVQQVAWRGRYRQHVQGKRKRWSMAAGKYRKAAAKAGRWWHSTWQKCAGGGGRRQQRRYRTAGGSARQAGGSRQAAHKGRRYGKNDKQMPRKIQPNEQRINKG